jgi:DNA helicase IV
MIDIETVFEYVSEFNENVKSFKRSTEETDFWEVFVVLNSLGFDLPTIDIRYVLKYRIDKIGNYWKYSLQGKDNKNSRLFVNYLERGDFAKARKLKERLINNNDILNKIEEYYINKYSEIFVKSSLGSILKNNFNQNSLEIKELCSNNKNYSINYFVTLNKVFRHLDNLEFDQAISLFKGLYKGSGVEAVFTLYMREKLGTLLKLPLKDGNYLEADTFAFEYEKYFPEEKYTDLKSEFVKEEIKKYCEDVDQEKFEILSLPLKNILTIARAGTGKTMLISLRVIQLINNYDIDPSEILCLAFNKDAALQLRTRINKYLKKELVGDGICTFHSLAHRILFPKGKDSSIKFVSTPNSEDIEYQKENSMPVYISQIFEGLIKRDKEFALRAYHVIENLPEINLRKGLQTDLDEYEYVKNREYITLDGNRVSSRPEKYIADFFFENELFYKGKLLKYSYEKYNKQLLAEPDFTLEYAELSSEPILILEYYGITGRTNIEKNFMTNNEKEAYLKHNDEKMSKAREIKLKYEYITREDIKGYYEREKRESVLAKLKEILNEKDIKFKELSELEKIEKFIKNKVVINHIHKLLTNFISRCKKLALKPEQIETILKKKSDNSVLNESFIYIVKKVFEEYQKVLKSENKIDFDDLLSLATEKVEKMKADITIDNNGSEISLKNIKYIFIDEFQDFSFLFSKLLKSLRKYSEQHIYFVVGDNWQAINGYAGSDIKFIEDIDSFFPEKFTQKELVNNYRSSKSVIKYSNSIMLNHAIGKGAKAISIEEGICEVLPYTCSNISMYEANCERLKVPYGKRYTMRGLLSTMESIIKDSNPKDEIIILARTNTLQGVTLSRIEELVKYFNKKYKITSSTIHRYKGQEKDIVIIIESDNRNFPKLHPNSEFFSLIDFTLKDIRDEERRLFYVAASRAKKNLYVIYSKSEDSNWTGLTSFSPEGFGDMWDTEDFSYFY